MRRREGGRCFWFFGSQKRFKQLAARPAADARLPQAISRQFARTVNAAAVEVAKVVLVVKRKVQLVHAVLAPGMSATLHFTSGLTV